MIESESKIRLAVFTPAKGTASETFIRAHVERLPFEVVPFYGSELAIVDETGRKIWFWGSWFRIFASRITPRINAWLLEHLMARHLRDCNIRAVLAEYGTTGSNLAPACARSHIPLFVHFHGYDASIYDVLKAHRTTYRIMFDIAAGVVAVSKSMKEQLLTLGAQANRLHLNPCGVDPLRFTGGDPQNQPPNFLAVGRFVEKKAPHVTIRAFSHVVKAVPHAKLIFVGEGHLLGHCKRLVRDLGLNESIIFLGTRNSDEVCQLMRESRAFVQHSCVARNGDSEGTPVSVIEAQMTGLPVIATRHAGIPDVVIDGETGFLVSEGDGISMSKHMIRLANDAKLAGKLGIAARLRAKRYFTLDRHIEQLAEMIKSGVADATRKK